jgi:hypothetical protein
MSLDMEWIKGGEMLSFDNLSAQLNMRMIWIYLVMIPMVWAATMGMKGDKLAPLPGRRLSEMSLNGKEVLLKLQYKKQYSDCWHEVLDQVGRQCEAISPETQIALAGSCSF